MRDQVCSAFGRELARLVAGVDGARAAALVDLEGETVDYAADLDPFEVRVTAAHLRLILDAAKAQPALRSTVFTTIRTSRASFLVHDLVQGYALVLWLRPNARWSSALWDHVARCGQGLADEAGWLAEPWPGWQEVHVITDEVGRPCQIRLRQSETLERVEILGRYVAGLGGARRGWRVRLTTGPVGLEATIAQDEPSLEDGRDSSSHWWIDETVSPVSPSRIASELASDAPVNPLSPAAIRRAKAWTEVIRRWEKRSNHA